jgi:hypothetical protein
MTETLIPWAARFSAISKPINPPPATTARFIAQVVAGAFIGTSFVRSDLAQLKLLILPAIIQVTGYIILCTLLGILISKLFNIDDNTINIKRYLDTFSPKDLAVSSPKDRMFMS